MYLPPFSLFYPENRFSNIRKTNIKNPAISKNAGCTKNIKEFNFLYSHCLDSSALLLRTARRRRTLPLGVKCEKAAPAQARRKQNRLWWLGSCLLAFPHLPVGADIRASAFLITVYLVHEFHRSGQKPLYVDISFGMLLECCLHIHHLSLGVLFHLKLLLYALPFCK